MLLIPDELEPPVLPVPAALLLPVFVLPPPLELLELDELLLELLEFDDVLLLLVFQLDELDCEA